MQAIHSLFKVGALCAALILSACAAPPSAITGIERPVTAPVSGGYDWAWDIAGDQPVRPIQVFTNGDKTWIQMAPYQVMPAVFVNGVPTSFDVTPPYLVIVGTPPQIDLIATSYRAVITRRATAAAANAPATPNTRITLVPSTEIK